MVATRGSSPLTTPFILFLACGLTACAGGAGSGGASSAQGVVLNEIDVFGRDWIELVNTSSDEPADLSGWALTDSLENMERHYLLPSGTVLEPGEYLVVKEADPEQGEDGFSFGVKPGDTVFLLDPDGNVIEQVAIGEVPGASAWGRYPDGTGSWQPTLPTQGATNQPATNPTEDISFDAGHMIVVEIAMAPADWEALESETFYGGQKGDFDLEEVASDCDMPWPKLYNWYSADVTIDGVTLQQVGVRKKGFFGSLSLENPGLKIKTDKFVEGQYFGDTERITLNNNAGDTTKLATCVAYRAFAAAGHPAPRCNLAQVHVNGEFLGLYIHIEAVKKRFLERVFGDSSGSLYEGVFTDFVEAWLPRWDPKTSDTDETFAPLLAVALALQAPDDELIAALEPVVNVERFITYWALEVILNHRDGHSGARNNFFVYFDPQDDGRAVLIPWGMDKTPSMEGMDVQDLSHTLFAELPRRLSRIPETSKAMLAELARLAAEDWDVVALLELTDTMAALVDEAGGGDPAAVETFRAWVQERPAFIAQLAAGGLPTGADETPTCWGASPKETGGKDDCYQLCVEGGGSDEDCKAKCAGMACEDGETYEKNGVTYVCEDGQWTSEKDSGGK